jgi:hypothetical protein
LVDDTLYTRAPPPQLRLEGDPAMYIGIFDWWREHFGRPDDQPVILAVVLVLIAITLYVFL